MDKHIIEEALNSEGKYYARTNSKLTRVISFITCGVVIGSIAMMARFSVNIDHAEIGEPTEVVSVYKPAVIEPETQKAIYTVKPVTITTGKAAEPITEVEEVAVEAKEVEAVSAQLDCYIDLTSNEKQMLASLLYLEARGESYECQKAIASVVINRFTTGNYNSISDVIYEKNQFTPAKYVKELVYNDEQIAAVEEICMNGPSIPEYVTYFRAHRYHSWGDLIAYKQIDSTYFSYSQALKAEVE